VRARARQVLEGLGLDLDLEARMTDLGLAKRQLVEIGKALSANARVLILDEPTASLNGVEADRLLATLTAMKARGVALVYISHRLDECFRLADEIVVLRNGYVASRRAPAETTTEQIVADMLGREYSEPELAAARERANRAPAVKVVDWATEQIPRLHGVSFEAHAGEVLAIFGLVGSGVESIARGLGGHPGMRISGSIEIDGQPQRPFRDPGAARRMHVGYVPAERKTDGLALARPVQEALTVLVTGQVSRAGVVRHRVERRLAKKLVAAFKVRCQSPGQPVGELSGGNQQKVLLASRLAAAPKLLVLHEPTRGVDVGARAQIHELVVAAARNGAAVVVVTSDLAEAIAVADRLHVVRQGVVVAELSGADKTDAAALTAATAASDPAGEGRAAS
jgi:ABC-type sugar transport system ATPase subunit